MSEYFFGLGRGRVRAEVRKQAEDVARKHGADFVVATIPGDGPRFWFACENRGQPFDGAVQKAVLANLEAEGLTEKLWPEKGTNHV